MGGGGGGGTVKRVLGHFIIIGTDLGWIHKIKSELFFDLCADLWEKWIWFPNEKCQKLFSRLLSVNGPLR